jgi:hypothetical protein
MAAAPSDIPNMNPSKTASKVSRYHAYVYLRVSVRDISMFDGGLRAEPFAVYDFVADDLEVGVEVNANVASGLSPRRSPIPVTADSQGKTCLRPESIVDGGPKLKNSDEATFARKRATFERSANASEDFRAKCF